MTRLSGSRRLELPAEDDGAEAPRAITANVRVSLGVYSCRDDDDGFGYVLLCELDCSSLIAMIAMIGPEAKASWDVQDGGRCSQSGA